LVPDTFLDEFPAYTVRTQAKKKRWFGKWVTWMEESKVAMVTGDEGTLIGSLL